MTATFFAFCFCTQYGVQGHLEQGADPVHHDARGTNTVPPPEWGWPTKLTFTWTIELKLVDKAGAPPPDQALSGPGSGAAVDIACNNAGDGLATPRLFTHDTTQTGWDETQYFASALFTWYHPDPPDSSPPGKYGCDHKLMGPSGHQGLVTVVVSDGTWQCKASYKGTNPSDKNSVRDGIASVPTCTAQ